MVELETHEEARRKELLKTMKAAAGVEKEIEATQAEMLKLRKHFKAERKRLDDEEKEANTKWIQAKAKRLAIGEAKQELTTLFLRDPSNRKRSGAIDRARAEVKTIERRAATGALGIKHHTEMVLRMRKHKVLPEELEEQVKKGATMEADQAALASGLKATQAELAELEKTHETKWRRFIKP